MCDADGNTRYGAIDQQRERDEADYECFLDSLRPYTVIDQHDGRWRIRVMRGERQFGDSTHVDTQIEALLFALDLTRIQRLKGQEG